MRVTGSSVGVLLSLILPAIPFTPVAADRQEERLCDRPLELRDLTDLVAGRVPAARIRQLIVTCGVDFALTDDLERRLRGLGATDAVIASMLPPVSPELGARWTAPIDRREMVWVLAGAFTMGSPVSETGREDDEAPHGVQIERGFWLDTAEVTHEAYRRFVLANPEWQKARIARALHDGNYLEDWKGNDFPPDRSSRPVVNVCWYAAQAYAKWAGKRLPTEAEWEFATRAGTETPYWWGDRFDSSRVPGASGPQGPGDRRTNRWGVADMLGGVWEWTATLYRDYPYAATDGREESAAKGARVIRGGSSANNENALRAANRNRDAPERCSDLLGFRCAR